MKKLNSLLIPVLGIGIGLMFLLKKQTTKYNVGDRIRLGDDVANTFNISGISNGMYFLERTDGGHSFWIETSTIDNSSVWKLI